MDNDKIADRIYIHSSAGSSTAGATGCTQYVPRSSARVQLNGSATRNIQGLLDKLWSKFSYSSPSDFELLLEIERKQTAGHARKHHCKISAAHPLQVFGESDITVAGFLVRKIGIASDCGCLLLRRTARREQSIQYAFASVSLLPTARFRVGLDQFLLGSLCGSKTWQYVSPSH